MFTSYHFLWHLSYGCITRVFELEHLAHAAKSPTFLPRKAYKWAASPCGLSGHCTIISVDFVRSILPLLPQREPGEGKQDIEHVHRLDH